MDGVTYPTPQAQQTATLTISNNTYGSTNVQANLLVPQYPVNSLALSGQKIMIQINGGYATTTGAPLSLFGYSPLWYNTMVNLYIYQQDPIALNTNVTLSFLNLINPQLYQMASYLTGSTITVNFYDAYQLITCYTFNQPAFNSFVLTSPLIYASTGLYYDDILQNIPFYSSLIYRFQIIIQDSPTDITTKQINNIRITFGSNVSLV